MSAERVEWFEGMMIRLCSAWNDLNKVTCDLPADHKGAHKATVYWEQDEGEADD